MIAIYLFRLNPVAAMLTNYLCTPLNVASVPLFMYVRHRDSQPDSGVHGAVLTNADTPSTHSRPSHSVCANAL